MPGDDDVVPKVHQVLHVRAKSILSCTFGRSAASSRTSVAPPPSYQSVTVDGTTTLYYLDSHGGTMRTIGSVHWNDEVREHKGKKRATHRVIVGDHTGDFGEVLRVGKGLTKDLKFRSDTRALYLPGSDSGPLHFQRVAIPSGGFPYTVYTITDASLPPGPTPAHTCVGQLTIKHIAKARAQTTERPSPGRLWPFWSADAPSHSAEHDNDLVVRLELRTRDKALIDKIAFGSLLVISGKHPIEADARVEADRVAGEWDAPPALSDLTTPLLTPDPSAEHLDLPEYRASGSHERLLPSQPIAGPSAGRSA